MSASSWPELPPSSCGIRNGWNGAEAVTELEQLLVVDREQRALQRREHRQLVVGPLDRGERGADGFDLLAAVKRLAADEQVRDAARLDRVDVRARDVVAEADEPAEQDRDVPRLQRHAPLGAVRLPLGRPSSRSSSVSQAMNAPTASGSDSSIAFADAFRPPKPPRPYGFGTGSATIGRLRVVAGAVLAPAAT